MSYWQEAIDRVAREAAGPYKETVRETATNPEFLEGVRAIIAQAGELTAEEAAEEFAAVNRRHFISPVLAPLIYRHVPHLLEAQDKDALVLEQDAGITRLDQVRRAA